MWLLRQQHLVVEFLHRTVVDWLAWKQQLVAVRYGYNYWLAYD
jgi:hypothetical protein